MNTINVEISFTKGTNKLSGINLITGDYASTKMIFQFDRADGRKVLEMKNPSGDLVYLGEIQNNEVLLCAVEDDLNYSIFNQEGRYIYEVSLYDGDSKLTSVKGELPVQKEQVIINGEIIEPYLPYFDQLMQELSTAIGQTDNLNIEASKVDTTTTITITKKDGTTTQVQVKDGEQGEQGEQGPAGSIKIIVVETLPTQDIDTSAIYLVPSQETESQNNYEEYVYINNQWEKLGEVPIATDLTDYVKNTDYATSSKGGVIKVGGIGLGYSIGQTGDNAGKLEARILTYTQYQNNLYTNGFVGKGTLENVITGKDLTTKAYVDEIVGDIGIILDEINGEVIGG